jgi:hypothetical protein
LCDGELVVIAKDVSLGAVQRLHSANRHFDVAGFVVAVSGFDVPRAALEIADRLAVAVIPQVQLSVTGWEGMVVVILLCLLLHW